jgi:hypothetical protein
MFQKDFKHYAWDRGWWRVRGGGWLSRCVTSRKVEGSIPVGVTGIFHLHNPFGRPAVNSVSNRNVRGGNGWRIGLTLLASCTDCLEILEPSHTWSLRACPDQWWDSFTFLNTGDRPCPVISGFSRKVAENGAFSGLSRFPTERVITHPVRSVRQNHYNSFPSTLHPAHWFLAHITSYSRRYTKVSIILGVTT